MRLFDILATINPAINPMDVKVHLCGRSANAFGLYLAGKFYKRRYRQLRKNFDRKFVVFLISLPGRDRWLFAGLYYSSLLSKNQYPSFPDPLFLKDYKRRHKGDVCFAISYTYDYELIEDKDCQKINGHIVVSFPRPGRQSYLKAENWAGQIIVSEIFSEQLFIGEFPGFKAVSITKDELDLIVRNSLESWRIALSNVAGVYLISDAVSGKLYVGSASGEGGIWQRWSCYAANGHGENKEIRKLLREGGMERARSFRYSILEIADEHMSRKDILKRESHWKDILMSRTYGLNSN